jgi:23S rRNA pseudouridine2605 synthase
MPGKEKPPAPKTTAKDAETPEGERIAKVLSRAGIASRREAERLIELGEVKVNGKTISSPALNVTPKDKITVRGEPVGQPEPPRLWLYYKPEGLVTSASDEKGRDTVFDHLPEDMPRVMSIGRLDLNSEGLLLLTNDGELKRKLELPSTGWLRKYRVRVKGNPTEPEIEPLRKGITIDGERFQGMEVKIDRHQGANAWLTVGLREGKNREIRRAMNHIGLTVNRLIRISYGPFRLNELQPGEVEELKPRVLREQLGLSDPEESPKPVRKLAPRQAKTGTRATGPGEDRGKPAGKPLKPGEGLKQLSEAWQKATRPPARKDERSADRPTTTRTPRPHGAPSRSGPRPTGPKKG